MRQAKALLFFTAAHALFMAVGAANARQGPSNNPAEQQNIKAAGATLRICLRLEDETLFLGRASVRLTMNEGVVVAVQVPELQGEIRFSELKAGKYEVEVDALGYEAAPVSTEIDAGVRQRTVYVVMKPKTLHVGTEKGPTGTKEETPAKANEETPTKAPEGAAALLPASKAKRDVGPNYWAPHELERVVPPVDASAACTLPKVLEGVAQRMEEFIGNLEKFAATERVEHYAVNGEKLRGSPDTRKFDYVVTVTQNRVGTFLLDEYRNGLSGPEQFPAHIATLGLPALALLFHPQLASDFNFACEGLGEWGGRPAWQVHFAQRGDRPVRMRAYVVNGKVSEVRLQGRAWIDPGSFQVMRMESELMEPIPQIELAAEHISVDYEQVQFRTQKIQIWLPRQGELYVERRGHRYYRKHTFSDFQIFNVDTSQNILAPRESYTFTNVSDRDVAGVLTVVPESGAKHQAVTLTFTVPARGRIFKVVGPGKDVNLPVTEVASATFTHNGVDGAIKVDAELAKETTLDVIPEGSVH
jgi:hypothetical protein